MMLETTTDCIERAREILAEAEKITTREEHARVWDKKVEVLKVVNDCFQTGAFTGEAYDELWEAKHLLYKIERIAGDRALKTYAREEA